MQQGKRTHTGRRIVASILSLLLAVTAFELALPQAALNVYAATEKSESNTALGVSNISNPTPGAGGWSYVYYGRYGGSAMKYRVLDKASNDFGGNTMLLDCDSTITNKSYAHVSSITWDGDYCEIRPWLNGDDFYGNYNKTDVFTRQEQAAIAGSTKGSPAGGDGEGYDVLSYAPLTGEHIFLLDAKEATRSSYGYAGSSDNDNTRKKSGTSNMWWLRSVHAEQDGPYKAGHAGYVHDDGKIIHDKGEFEYGVSPAFNIDLKSVIFSSVISGTAGEKGAEYKLTIKDEGMSAAVTSGQEVTRSGDTITVPYTVTDVTNRVSVLITDGEFTLGASSLPNVKYYGALTTDGGNIEISGTGTFTLPEDFDDSWKVYILAEKTSGDDKLTDYASVPVEISVPDEVEYTITCSADGNGTASASTTTATEGTEVTLTATPKSGYAFKEWQVVSGGVTITDNKFTMPAGNVEVKAIFEALPPSTYSVTMTNDGHGSASATPTSGAAGTTVTIKAAASSDYQFAEWQVLSGGVVLADANSATTTFKIKNANVSIKAVFEKKSDDDSDDNSGNPDNSGNSGGKSKDEKKYDYSDELSSELKTAIDLGGQQTVTWDKGTALSYDNMKTLQDNPNITLVFSYTYENVDFKVTLNGKNVKAYKNIPWYGPLYLYKYYGGRSAVQNAPAANAKRTYTIVKGDTLTGIAIKLNTTVRHLVSLNNIKNPDRISVDQVLKY